MVYVEYNNSKPVRTTYEINITESEERGDYELLPFSPQNVMYPTSSTLLDQVTEEEDFLLRLIAIKTYYNNNYCLYYDGNYYQFKAEIKKNDIVYFKEEDGEFILEVDSYSQNKVILPVFDTIEITRSGNEISFSSIKADYGLRTMNDLPMAYQEIRIWDGELIGTSDLSNCELIYTGYLDNVSVTQKHNETDECDIEFNLISPMSLTTRKSLILVGTYKVKDLLQEVLTPLVNDGYQIGTVLVKDGEITVSYYLETLETILNDLSNKLNIFWTIDEKKKIYVYDIDSLFSKEPVLTIDDNNNLEGLYELKPSIENNNYFNTINIKNARIYRTQRNKALLDVMKLINDEELELTNPIDFGTNGASRVCSNNETDSCTILKIVNSSNTTLYDIKYQNGQIVLPSGVVFSDEDTEGATMILKRDSFFKNLVIEIEWKGSTQSLKVIESDTVLNYEIFKYFNSQEIDKSAGYLTDSGIIEETIDANESWFTYNEIVDYCNNLIIANSKITANVDLSVDENYNLKVGDLIRINKPEFFVSGDFVITEVSETISGYNGYDCQVKAQNNKLQSNYIDIFRKKELEQEESKYNKVNFVNYITEGITQKQGIYEEE